MDDSRFESAWSSHGAAVLRYCTYSTGSRDAGEDVAAETFARFLAKGDRIADDRIEAWLIRVARNLCANHHRDAARQFRLVGRIADDSTESGDEWMRPDSWQYVRHLKEAERLVIYLRLAEDRSFADVARLVGKSESATKMTFYRAIDRLRLEMQRDGAGTDFSLAGGANHV